MSRSDLAVQQPDESLNQLPSQPPEAEGSAGVLSKPGPYQTEKQKKRTPELQAKIERIGKIETYAGTPRDDKLFDHLNHWRDLRICARVITNDRLGLSKSIDFYKNQHVKRRGDLLQIPAPVALIESEDNCSAKGLFMLILMFLCNSLDCGSLQELRSRTWGTLNAYKVKILIVNHAELLSFSALYELVRISEKLKISIVLAGSPALNDLLNPQVNFKKRYASVYNRFLKYHHFDLLSVEATATIIANWETEELLRWNKPLNLKQKGAIVRRLHKLSEGQLEPLYDNLKEIAVWMLDHPEAQINAKNITTVLKNQHRPSPEYDPV